MFYNLSISFNPVTFYRLRGNKYTYRLKAVIVHSGDHNAGHFSTYRRGVSEEHSRHRCSDTRYFSILHAFLCLES